MKLKPRSLHAVLAIRVKQEESQEQVLARLAQELRQTKLQHERIAQEATAARNLRLEEGNCRANGAHHHRWDARMKQIRQRQSDTTTEIERLQRAYEEQMQRYLEARRAREVISELEQKHASAWRAELELREQKRYDELFLARFVRD